jgi:hypothetical protein
MLFGMRRGTGIAVLLLLLGVIPLGVLGITSMIRSTGELTRQVFSQLEGLREIKRAQLLRFFDERRSDLRGLVLCMHRFRSDALRELSAIHATRKALLESRLGAEALGLKKRDTRLHPDPLSMLSQRHRSRIIHPGENKDPLESEPWKPRPIVASSVVEHDEAIAHARLGPAQKDRPRHIDDLVLLDGLRASSGPQCYLETRIGLREALIVEPQEPGEDFFQTFVEEKGYYDLLLIDPGGRVLFSTAREPDYGTNMLTGRYADSSLGRLVRKILATGDMGMADFEPYAPSGNEPAAFIASPFPAKGGTELIVALQLSVEAINRIMLERTGLGETGETYLVGPDLLMRSDSHLDPVHHSLKASFADPEQGKVDTEASRDALAGRRGEKIIVDYNGNPVLSAYTPVKVWDVTWALVAEMDAAEAFESANRLAWVIGIVAILSIAAIVAVALLLVLLLLNRPQGTPSSTATVGKQQAAGGVK